MLEQRHLNQLEAISHIAWLEYRMVANKVFAQQIKPTLDKYNLELITGHGWFVVFNDCLKWICMSRKYTGDNPEIKCIEEILRTLIPNTSESLGNLMPSYNPEGKE